MNVLLRIARAGCGFRRPLLDRGVAVLLGMMVAAACSDENTGSPAEVLWVKNIATDAESLRVVVGGDDFLTIAAYNRGVIDVGGGEVGFESGLWLLLARFDPSGRHDWSRAIEGDFDSGHRIGLALTPENDVVVTVAGFSDAVDFGLGTIDPGLGTQRSGVLFCLSGQDGITQEQRDLILGDSVVIPHDVTVFPEFSSVQTDVLVTGLAQRSVDDQGIALNPPAQPEVFAGRFGLGINQPVWNQTVESTHPPSRVRGEISGDGTVFVTSFAPVPGGTENSGDGVLLRLDRDGGSRSVQPLTEATVGPLNIAADTPQRLLVAGNFLVSSEGAERPPLASALTIARYTPATTLDGDPTVDWSLELVPAQGGSSIEATGIETDLRGNLVVVGNFTGTLSFQTVDLSVQTLGTDCSADPTACQAALFVLKIDPDGRIRWGRFSGGTGGVIASDVGIDSQSNVVASGLFKGLVAEEDPTAIPPNEAFFLKLAP